jgi:predicted PurR-regulated permease PerM
MGIRRDPDPSRLLPILTDRLGRLALRSAQLLLVGAVVVVVVQALVRLHVVVIPFLLAAILAAAFSPLVRLLRARGVPRAVASTLTLVGGLLVVGVLIVFVVYTSATQWKAVIAAASDGFEQVQAFLIQLRLPVDQSQLADLQRSVSKFLTSPEFGSTALAGLSVATEFLTSAFLLVVLLFFFLQDGDTMWAFLLRPASPEGRARGQRVGGTAVRVLGGYARGTTIVAFAGAVPIGLALFLLQIPLALPLTVLMFLATFVPIVGGIVVGILAVLVALVTNGPTAAIVLAIVVVVIQQVQGNVLTPMVLSRYLRLHALVILVAITAGSIVGGIIGAVLAVPVAALAWEIVKVWDPPGEERGRDAVLEPGEG